MKIAVVGTGISGLSAAWLLHETHDITVYEKEARLGGHSNTMDVDYDGVPMSVDTGFIVYNDLNYINLNALFEHLGVQTQGSNMSFGVSVDRGRLEWSSDTLASIFAQKRNLARPSFLAMLRNIFRFNKLALRDLENGALCGLTLGEYLERGRFGRGFRDYYLLPMGAAIWSTSTADMLDFPAESFVNFFNNHRLLHTERPAWRTVVGGSRQYVTKLAAPFHDRVRAGAGVTQVRRLAETGGVEVTDETGHTETYDQVILACHSDQALSMLSDADEKERRILGALRYAPNTVYLHRDPALMPTRRKVWSSWNYMCNGVDSGGKVSVSYWMNRLQSLDYKRPLFVSLNPEQAPREELTFKEMTYDHPQFDAAALTAQKLMDEIQGVRGVWFAGAYCGHGFHEDGLKAGLSVAERLSGLVRPWARAADEAAPIAEAAE